jgi:hypothetical protein
MGCLRVQCGNAGKEKWVFLRAWYLTKFDDVATGVTQVDGIDAAVRGRWGAKWLCAEGDTPCILGSAIVDKK